MAALRRAILGALFGLVVESWQPHRAQADGAMELREHVLFRTGPEARKYCEVPSDECPALLTKTLSGYGFLRGAVRGAVSVEPERGTPLSGFGALHLDAVSAALPGGDLAVGSFDGVLAGRSDRTRLRLTLVDMESVFACHETQHDSWMFPFIGMTSSQCRGDAVVGLDARALRFQWDAFDQHLLAEWFHAGPAFELLHNGLSQSHLLRSVVLAALFDAQTRYAPRSSHSSGSSLGGGLRLSAFYRTPDWEARLRATERSVLAGGAGIGYDHRVESELRLVRNWFLTDALVVQTGLSFAWAWASQPWLSDALFASRSSHTSLAAGFYLGWVSESPGI